MTTRPLVLVLLAPLVSAPLAAADFVVTRYDDPVPDGCLADDCSLREAVIAANADSDLDRILLSAGVYLVNLPGSGENLAATGDIDVEEDAEIVGAGAGVTILDATGLDETTIAATDPGLDFELSNVTMRDSSVGALLLGSGTHVVEECEFVNNGATSSNSAIRTSIGSTVTIRRSSLVGNPGRGLTVTQGSATVENSTLSGNGAQDLALTQAVDFLCSHCTISDPTDGTLEVQVGDSVAKFANSVVAGDCGYLGTGAIDSLGGNVESSGDTCQFDQATDKVSQSSGDLDLGALADNGGPTRTHLPGGASAAGDNAVDANCLATDQRGVARTTDCESGSVERTDDSVATPIFLDGFLQGDTEAWSSTSG